MQGINLSPEEARERLRISRNCMYALCRRTGFPSFRVGRKILIPSDALERWIQEGGTGKNGTENVG